MMGPEQVVAEHRREQRRNGVIWLVFALILAMVLGFAYRTDERADDGDREIETLSGQVQVNGQIAQSAKDAAEEANRRLRAAGKPTVPVPTESPISPTVAPPAVMDELTAAEVLAVRAIVTDQLSRQKVTITQAEISQIARTAAVLVPKPADGKTPTEAQIRPVVVATVAAYCVGDKCVGKPGNKGEKGDKGDRGEDAPKVTDEELLAASKLALAAYCGLESQPCKGPPGDPGATVTGPPGADGVKGSDGADGRSVVDMDCMEDGRWRITYDRALPNGEMTSYSRGPCRIPAVDPTPTDPTPASKKSR